MSEHGARDPRGRRVPAALIVAALLASCGGNGPQTLPLAEGTSTSTQVESPSPSPVSVSSSTPGSSSTTTGGATTSTTAAAPDTLRVACQEAACLEGVTVDYLVVTRPVFIQALADFLQWKADLGFSVGLVTVDWLEGTFAGDDTAERMKAGMHAIRRAAAPSGIMYVLLVGDTEVARDDYSIDAVLRSYSLEEPWNTPTGYYRRVSSDPAGEVLPSDAYFVEDADWDPDGTGLNPIGGDTGQGTMQPTIYLGRWSVRTPGELEAVVAKTMQAEPASSMLVTFDVEFWGTGCCDRWPPNDAWFGTGTKSCCYNAPQIAVDRLLGPQTPWITTEVIPIDFLAPEPEAFAQFLATEGAATIAFHGMYQCLSMTYGLCVDGAAMQFDHVFPVLEASGCYVASFYSGSTDTLFEAILKQPTGPAVVAQAGHNEYGFIEAMVAGRPVGDAFWAPAADYVYWLNPIVLLGDPSLVVLQGPPA